MGVWGEMGKKGIWGPDASVGIPLRERIKNNTYKVILTGVVLFVFFIPV